MLATPHLMVGAAIGKTLRRPWLAWPVAFVSHFLLDFVPHLDSHALFGVPSGGPTLPEAGMAIADVLVGTAAVAWLVAGQPERRVMLGAAFFAILVDLMFNVPPWAPWLTAWPGTAWLAALHRASEQNVTPAQWPVGVGTQVVAVAAALWLILRLNRAPVPTSGDGRIPLA
jgi:hypothetical protein